VGRDAELVTAETTIAAPPERVFAALTDPATYPHWLRGCKDIRGVDATWPAPGSAFCWPSICAPGTRTRCGSSGSSSRR